MIHRAMSLCSPFLALLLTGSAFAADEPRQAMLTEPAPSIEPSQEGPPATARGLIRSADLGVILPHVSQKTLVVFDIDDTLISDGETTDISAVKERSSKITYLTSRRIKHEKRTRKKLWRRGVLASSDWLPEPLRTYQVIFTGQGSELGHKGPYLVDTVDELLAGGVPLSNVVFVDDRPSQVASVVESFSEHAVPVLGVVFERYVVRDDRDKVVASESDSDEEENDKAGGHGNSADGGFVESADAEAGEAAAHSSDGIKRTKADPCTDGVQGTASVQGMNAPHYTDAA